MHFQVRLDTLRIRMALLSHLLADKSLKGQWKVSPVLLFDRLIEYHFDLKGQWLIQLFGQQRNPIHPDAARMIDLHPGDALTVHFTAAARAEHHVLASAPYFCLAADDAWTYREWRVKTTDGLYLRLDFLGILPDHLTDWPENAGFNPHVYTTID